jgi:hypothetical protein
MTSIDNRPDHRPDPIITAPADIDHSRYRVILGRVRRVARPIHESEEVRVVGADTPSAARTWLGQQLTGYLTPEQLQRADGARAAIVEVNAADATTRLVSSLYGPTPAVLDHVVQLTRCTSAATRPDFSRPYQARLYNAEDLINYQSPPLRTEAAARIWFQDMAERAHNDGVQAGITRLDPTLGWPRPVFEFAAVRPNFGAKLHSSLTYLDNADDAFLLGPRAGGAPTVLAAYQNTTRGLQAQTSANTGRHPRAPHSPPPSDGARPGSTPSPCSRIAWPIRPHAGAAPRSRHPRPGMASDLRRDSRARPPRQPTT